MRQVTATEKYRAVNEGIMDKSEFVRQMKLAWPQFVSPANGYDDTVQILKNYNILHETKEAKEAADVSKFSDDSLKRAIDIELEAMGLMSQETISGEDQSKAKTKAVKNLRKDPLHYYNLIAGESSKVSKNDKEVEVKRGEAKQDVFNSMKKAELKEGELPPALKKAIEKKKKKKKEDVSEADAIPTEPGVTKMGDDGKEYGVRASNHDRKMAMRKVIDFLTITGHPDSGHKVDNDDAIDFIKTHKDDLFSGDIDAYDIEDVWMNYDEYDAVNRDSMDPTRFTSEENNTIKDGKKLKKLTVGGKTYEKGVPDPYGEGRIYSIEKYSNGYYINGGIYSDYGDGDEPKEMYSYAIDLKGNKVEEEELDMYNELRGYNRRGEKEIESEPSRFKGRDKSKLRATNEKMSDEFMDQVKNYGKDNSARIKPYEPGDHWSEEFDYSGMLKAALKIRINTPLSMMQKIYDSFEDVNYHRENVHLNGAMDALKNGNKQEASEYLKDHKKEIASTIRQMSESTDRNFVREGFYGQSNMDTIAGALGYDDLDEFLNDNPGATEGMIEWIGSVPEFRTKLSKEFSSSELENMGFYNIPGYDSEEDLDEKKVKEDFSPSPNSNIPDANAEEYDVATAFKKAKVDMSKPVMVLHTYGSAAYGGYDEDEMSAEAAIEKLEAERQDRSKQYTDDGEEVPEDHHGYEFHNSSIFEKDMPEGHEYKLAYFQLGDADYVITQEKSGVSEKKVNENIEAFSDTIQVVGYPKTVEDALKVIERYERDRDPVSREEAKEIVADMRATDDDDFDRNITNLIVKAFNIKLKGVSEKKGKDHDGDGDVDGDDYMASKDKAIKKAMGKDEQLVKENLKSIITKVLEEKTINEAATAKLADWGKGYEAFPGVKPVVIELENIVTEIEQFYDKIGDKIAKTFSKTGDFRNEEGLKIGAFISPSLESAFKQDLRPVVKGGFTKKIELPKVRTISQADINRGSVAETEVEEEKVNVFSPNQQPAVNGTLRETKKK